MNMELWNKFFSMDKKKLMNHMTKRILVGEFTLFRLRSGVVS